jgi:hypothetical protein
MTDRFPVRWGTTSSSSTGPWSHGRGAFEDGDVAERRYGDEETPTAGCPPPSNAPRPWGLANLTILILWHDQAGQPDADLNSRRQTAPWYWRKHHVSVEDMIIAFRRARITDITAAQDTPRPIRRDCRDQPCYSRVTAKLQQRRSARCGAARRQRPRKCHEFETDLGDIAVRQARTRRSHKINMSREVRSYM